MLSGPENFFTIDKFSVFTSFTNDKFNCNEIVTGMKMHGLISSCLLKNDQIIREKSCEWSAGVWEGSVLMNGNITLTQCRLHGEVVYPIYMDNLCH